MDTSPQVSDVSSPTESAPIENKPKSRSGMKILVILGVVFLVLAVLLGGLAAGGYFFYLKPRKEKFDKLTKLESQLVKVEDEMIEVSNQYDTMKDHILRFNEQGGTDDNIRTENPLLNILGASTQDHESAEESYLKDLTDKINDNLSKLKVKGFSSQNKGQLEELPQTGEDNYLEATDATKAVASKGVDEISKLQKELDNLKSEYSKANITDSNLKSEYDKYISDTETYINETSEVFKFYEFTLQLSADYYRADLDLYNKLNIIYDSDDPTPYLSSLEDSRKSFLEMQDKLAQYDVDEVPEELKSLHQMNKEVLQITVDFIADAIDAMEALDGESFFNAYVKYLSDRLSKNTTYDRKDIAFWKGTKADDRYNALKDQGDKLDQVIKDLKDKNKSPL